MFYYNVLGINFHQIPDFNFVKQNGESVTQEHLEGQIYVAGFFFSTCPGICPAVRSKLKNVQDVFIDDPSIKIVQRSIRPTSDTPAVLKAYAQENGIIDDKWYLNTASVNDLIADIKTLRAQN